MKIAGSSTHLIRRLYRLKYSTLDNKGKHKKDTNIRTFDNNHNRVPSFSHPHSHHFPPYPFEIFALSLCVCVYVSFSVYYGYYRSFVVSFDIIRTAIRPCSELGNSTVCQHIRLDQYHSLRSISTFIWCKIVWFSARDTVPF